MRVFIFLLLGSLCACSSAEPVTPKAEAAPQLERVDPAECRSLLSDDGSLESLQQAAVRDSAYFDEAGQATVNALDRSFSRASLAAIASSAAASSSVSELAETMCQRVSVYRVELPTAVSVSAYTDAPIRARRSRSGEFRYAVYEPPSDLIEVDLSQFCPGCDKRLASGRVSGSRVVPYYSRGEIEAGAIAGQDYELGWIGDPIEALLLELRGSGVLEFEDGTRMTLAYASNNGRDAGDPIAELVKAGKLPPARANLSGLRAYLQAHPYEAEALLRQRERVVFFGVAPVGPMGTAGTPITAGRTLAADPRYYPRGTLGFVRTTASNGQPALSRFIFIQDEQPGVTGAAQVSLFAGEDRQSGLADLQTTGELFLFLPN